MTYIIYDTALNGQYTLMHLQKEYTIYQSLFAGTRDEVLSDVAPYVFQVDEGLYEKVTGPLISLEAILVFTSEEKIEGLVLHFQPFIYEKIKGQEYYFRFWDARVIAKRLPSWPAEKLDSFFETVNCLYIINELEEKVLSYSFKRGKLQSKGINLSEIFNVYSSVPVSQEEPQDSGPKEKKKRKFFTD